MNNKSSAALRRIRLERIATPSRILMAGFGILILIGTGLFCLPAASTGEPLSFADALYTATSAVCVTGLTVVEPAQDLTFFGQLLLILLIQVGGLGFMTFGTMLMMLFRRRLSLRQRVALTDSMNAEEIGGIAALTARVALTALSIEAIGAVLLMATAVPQYGAKGVWIAVFHSISAFCNAGFDLVCGIENCKNDPATLLVLCMLISLGGIGFTVMFDLVRKKFRFGALELHSRLVLVISGILTFGGALLFLLLEGRNPLTLGDAELRPGMKWIGALFESITMRTAGFQTFAQSGLTPAGYLLALLLMFVGASPASTGGGLKTTTIGVFFLLIYNVLRGREEIVVGERTIKQNLINRAVVLLTLALTMVMIAYLLLTLILPQTQAVTPEHILFEVVSGFDTVGLTIGVTAELNLAGKLLMCAVMFTGRVGLLTIAMALTHRQAKGKNHLTYPEGKIMIG